MSNMFVVRSISDFKQIELNVKNKNLMLVVLGMSEDDSMDNQWYSYFHPDYVDDSNWVTVFVRNESHGFISDLFESIVGKLFNGISEALFKTSLEHPSRILEYIITNRQNKNNKTVIVCHSQGGIITVNALNSCDKSSCKNIKIAFLGSANWTLPSHINSNNCLCISTKLDYVCIPCGRYFLPSTVKLSKYTTHDISKYARVMSSISRQATQFPFSNFNRNEIKQC